MKIGIFTAMQSEARTFVQNAEKTTIGMHTFYTFKLGNNDAVLCCPPSVGEICATSACQMLISNFNVDVILNFGIVGALTAEMSLQQTVLVKGVVHYDMDTTAIDEGFVVGQYGCFDSVVVDCDINLINKSLQVFDMPLAVCASADKFVADSSAKSQLNKTFGATICDMESAAVLFTCKFNNVPCLMVKCISDSLFGNQDEYNQNKFKSTQDFFNIAISLAEVF